MNYIQDIQKKQEIKKFWTSIIESWNKYQNKFAYRKVQTNNWLKWVNQNKNLLPQKWIPLSEWKLLKWIYQCCNYKIDWIAPYEKPWKDNFWVNVRFVSWISCKRYKLCANCARLKANKNKAKFLEFLNKNPELEKKNWYYLVLTIRHKKDDDLVELFRRLTGGIQKIRQSIKDSKRWRNNSIFQYIEGSLLSIEVTYWNNWWHPHCNFLFCSDHHFPLTKKWTTLINKEITEAWKTITLDSDITSIQKVEVKEKVYEVLKYITKFSELPHDKRLELHFRTKGFKFLRSWGSLSKSNVSEEWNFDAEKRAQYEILVPTSWDRNKEKYKINPEYFEEFNTQNWLQIDPDFQELTKAVINILKPRENKKGASPL